MRLAAGDSSWGDRGRRRRPKSRSSRQYRAIRNFGIADNGLGADTLFSDGTFARYFERRQCRRQVGSDPLYHDACATPGQSGQHAVRRRASSKVELDCHAFAGAAGDRADFCRQMDLNALALHELQEERPHLFILARGQSRPGLENCDSVAEAAERLRQLETDIAAANDDEVFGQPAELQGLDIRKRSSRAQPGDIRDRRVRAEIEEQTVRRQRALRAAIIQRTDSVFGPVRRAVPMMSSAPLVLKRV
jgi:hypothetical protein